MKGIFTDKGLLKLVIRLFTTLVLLTVIFLLGTKFGYNQGINKRMEQYRNLFHEGIQQGKSEQDQYYRDKYKCYFK